MVKPGATGAELEEVTVTAEKRSENLQSAPLAVTAVSGDFISQGNIKDPRDLQEKLPAVEFMSATIPSVIIRGVGTYNNQTGVTSAVAYSVDGVYLAHIAALSPVLYDIGQVEAVRGPQGTLLGANSNGGAVAFTTNKPVLGQFDASADITFGNYSDIGSEAMVNIPLGDKVAVRGAFGSDDHDAYKYGGFNNANDRGGRVRLLVEPSDNFNFTATVDYSQTDDVGDETSYCPPRAAEKVCATIPWNPYGSFGAATVSNGDHFFVHNFGAYAEANYLMDWATVTSLTGYRQYELREKLHNFPDFHYGPNSTSDFITQELRLSSPASSAIKWVGGVYYTREGLSGEDRFGIPTDNGDTNYDTGNIPLFAFDTPGETKTNIAVYGQAVYPITDDLRLTGGLRYTDVDSRNFGVGILYGANNTQTRIPTGGINDLDQVTWKVGVDYDLSATSLLYANASTGFKEGGVNEVPPKPAFIQSYAPEKILAFQAGTKNRFFDNKIQVNAEGFYYDYKGYQSFQNEADVGPGALPGTYYATVNSQKATFYGGEIEASAAVTEDDRLDLSLALLHATFDKYVLQSAGIVTANFSGNHVQGAPPYTLGASWTHVIELGDYGTLTGVADTKLVAGNYVDNSNVPGVYQPQYTRTSATLTYEDPSGQWTVSAFAKNLENAAILESYAGQVYTGGDGVFVYPPRTYGVSIKWKLPTPAASEPYEQPAPPPAPPAPAPVAAAPEAQRSFQVFFDFDKSAITGAAASVIQAAADAVKAGNVVKIAVIGHTDTVGSAAYNQGLSERRAAAVKAQMVADGVSGGDITTVGVGKTGLLVPTADGVREPQNRRAEIVLR